MQPAFVKPLLICINKITAIKIKICGRSKIMIYVRTKKQGKKVCKTYSGPKLSKLARANLFLFAASKCGHS